jgi:hypothetical protein
VPRPGIGLPEPGSDGRPVRTRTRCGYRQVGIRTGQLAGTGNSRTGEVGGSARGHGQVATLPSHSGEQDSHFAMGPTSRVFRPPQGVHAVRGCRPRAHPIPLAACTFWL